MPGFGLVCRSMIVWYLLFLTPFHHTCVHTCTHTLTHIHTPTYAQLCSIIVFGCVSDQVSTTSGCAYAGNSDACNFAIAVGVIGFLLCLVFLVKDVLFVIVDYSDNIVVSSYIYHMVDLWSNILPYSL